MVCHKSLFFSDPLDNNNKVFQVDLHMVQHLLARPVRESPPLLIFLDYHIFGISVVSCWCCIFQFIQRVRSFHYPGGSGVVDHFLHCFYRCAKERRQFYISYWDRKVEDYQMFLLFL